MHNQQKYVTVLVPIIHITQLWWQLIKSCCFPMFTYGSIYLGSIYADSPNAVCTDSCIFASLWAKHEWMDACMHEWMKVWLKRMYFPVWLLVLQIIHLTLWYFSDSDLCTVTEEKSLVSYAFQGNFEIGMFSLERIVTILQKHQAGIQSLVGFRRALSSSTYSFTWTQDSKEH